jgi:hypothetical protein
MDTKNGSRDRQMREMFEGGKYPLILAVLKDIEPEKVLEEMRKAPGGKTPVEFNLKIRNIERKIRAVIVNLKESPGHISFDAEFPVSLKDYELKPPKVLFGAISVRDSVTVRIAFSLDKVQAK